MLSAIALKVSRRMPTKKSPACAGLGGGFAKRSGSFFSQLNGLQKFPVLLRIGNNLPLRQAGKPLVVRHGPALAARADVAAMFQINGMFSLRLLRPAGAVGDAEYADVAARQQLQGILD